MASNDAFPDSGTVLVRTDEIVSSDLDGETVMLNIERGKYFGLDPIGSRIWNLLETPRSVASLCGQLVLEYDVDLDTCTADVRRLVASMLREGLVVEAGDGA